jgi:hypothetical protein
LGSNAGRFLYTPVRVFRCATAPCSEQVFLSWRASPQTFPFESEQKLFIMLAYRFTERGLKMAQMQIVINDKHYQYLQQRAQKQNMSLNQILSELIEADIVWQQKLISDPMQALFGQIEDSFDTKNVDDVVYGLESL